MEPSETAPCPVGSMLDILEEIRPDKAEQPVLPPYVSKRRRVHKCAINFGFSQDELPKEDPSITACRHREEYMAQRKISHPEDRTSIHETRPHNGSTLVKDRCTSAITPEQPEVTVEHNEHPPDTFEEAGNNFTVIHSYEAGQDDNNVIRRSFHQDVISSESGVSPHGLVETTLLSANSEPNMRHRLDLLASPQPQNPITANLEQPQLVLENHVVQSSLNNVSSRVEAMSSAQISQQSNPSGQAQSLPELLTPAMSHSELLDVPVAAQYTDAQLAIYCQFRSVYPDYRGSKEDFIGMSRQSLQHVYPTINHKQKRAIAKQWGQLVLSQRTIQTNSSGIADATTDEDGTIIFAIHPYDVYLEQEPEPVDDRLTTVAKDLDAIGMFKDSYFTLYHLDLHPYYIIVDVQSDGAANITGVLDWDSAVFAPDFVVCTPPSWIWAWQDDEDEPLDEADTGNELRVTFYAPQYRMARQLFDIALDGIRTNVSKKLMN
ncbi:MAG: hypothetical protein Q9198_007567 [Flavoplaca austrocitrina]